MRVWWEKNTNISLIFDHRSPLCQLKLDLKIMTRREVIRKRSVDAEAVEDVQVPDAVPVPIVVVAAEPLPARRKNNLIGQIMCVINDREFREDCFLVSVCGAFMVVFAVAISLKGPCNFHTCRGYKVAKPHTMYLFDTYNSGFCCPDGGSFCKALRFPCDTNPQYTIRAVFDHDGDDYCDFYYQHDYGNNADLDAVVNYTKTVLQDSNYRILRQQDNPTICHDLFQEENYSVIMIVSLFILAIIEFAFGTLMIISMRSAYVRFYQVTSKSEL